MQTMPAAPAFTHVASLGLPPVHQAKPAMLSEPAG